VPRPDTYVVVLWGDKCDEVAATIFVSELRQVGLRVKVVGLTRQQTSGACGLALVPDLTLEQVMPLVPQIICLVIPCSLHVAWLFRNDPRLRDFFEQLRTNQGRVIMGSLNGEDDLALFSLTRAEVTVYPDHETLVTFARQIASSLLSAF